MDDSALEARRVARTTGAGGVGDNTKPWASRPLQRGELTLPKKTGSFLQARRNSQCKLGSSLCLRKIKCKRNKRLKERSWDEPMTLLCMNHHITSLLGTFLDPSPRSLNGKIQVKLWLAGELISTSLELSTACFPESVVNSGFSYFLQSIECFGSHSIHCPCSHWRL